MELRFYCLYQRRNLKYVLKHEIHYIAYLPNVTIIKAARKFTHTNRLLNKWEIQNKWD